VKKVCRTEVRPEGTDEYEGGYPESIMKSIAVKFWEQPDMEVPVTLVTVPLLTADKATTAVFGRWLCTSPYIGKRSLGLYYVKRVPDPVCASDEQRWLGMCNLPRNPYAFFFDTDDEKQANYDGPFMFWDHFYLDIGSSSNGEGKLLQSEFVPGSGFTFQWKQIG
jgi:hypothetical protein